MTAWEALAQAGIVVGEPPEGDPASPWYVRAMVGAAGWMAAVFLLGFVFLGFDAWVEDSAARTVLGLVLVAGAGVLLRASENDFAIQLGLALSLVGQVLAGWGLVETLYGDGANEVAAYLTVAILEIALALAVANPIHRTWCVTAAAVFLWLAARASGFPGVGRGALAAIMAGLWLRELTRPRVHALVVAGAWGVSLALLGIEAYHVNQRAALAQLALAQRLPWNAYIGDALTGLVLLHVADRLGRRPPLAPTTGQRAAVVLAAGLVAIISVSAPGLSVGLSIVLLGFANGNRPLTGLGVAALLAAISAYYYDLETTLLVKSELLAAMGLGLLGARFITLRGVWPAAEDARA